MLPAHAPLLFLAAFLGGALNSVAGGGGFIVFPSLLFTGMMPINANATNTVALWPGTMASVGAYRGDLASREQWRGLLPLFIVTLIGSLAGAKILLRTPQMTFMRQVPWLLLGATLLFTFGGYMTKWVRARTERHLHASRAGVIGVAALQLVVSIYIGYFGAGAGILMLALLALMGMENIHTMNAFKTALASCANAIAMITFIVAKAVVWPQASLMIVGAMIGGYGGAWYAQKLDQKVVRYLVIALGAGMSAYFFWRR
ncbi:MAG TPA: sulfite exporter TauE/SafE family protein [Terriglobales bacterium]|nr:sulfite exporter TauE/SafE family protein [Terriglobales bacterium]